MTAPRLRRAAGRLARLPLAWLGIVLLTFVLLRLAPGDPGGVQAGLEPGVSSELALEAWRRLHGLEQPLTVQLWRWLVGVLTLDWGRSFVDGRPVLELLGEAAPRTFLLNGCALLVVYTAAIPFGLWAARRRGSRSEAWLSSLSLVAYAVPSFCAALLLLFLLGPAGGLGWFPLRGLGSDGLDDAGWVLRALDGLWHLVLPVFCLAAPAWVRTARYQRAAAAEVLEEDFIRVARAKGLSAWNVVWRHALRPALSPMATLFVLDLPVLVGGSAVIERIFTIRGLGMLLFDALMRRDHPVVLGVVTAVAALTVLGAVLGDVALAWLDPRVDDPRGAGLETASPAAAQLPGSAS